MTPISGHPLKWSKYPLLVQFGFVTHKELEHDIRRYKRSDRSTSVRDISLDLRAEKKDGHRHLYVVKLAGETGQPLWRSSLLEDHIGAKLEPIGLGWVRIPRDGDQRSELMSITIPK